MGFNSAFKGLKLLKKKPGNGRLNNLNDPVLNVLRLLGYYTMSTGKGLQTLQTFVVPSLARSGRLRRVVLLELLDPTFTLSRNPEG